MSDKTGVIMEPWVLALLFLCGLIVMLDLLIHLIYAGIALKRFEARPAFQVTPPPEEGPRPERVIFPTTNGMRLHGGVYYPHDGHPRGVIVFCPETDAVYQTALNYTPALLEAGFAVLSFDFRNEGDSDHLPTYQAMHWLSEYEVADVHAALDFVQSQPQFEGLPVGLFGVSRGGCAALAAAATRPEVRDVLAEGPFSTHQLALYYALKWIGAVVGGWRPLIPEWHVRLTLWFTLRFSEFRNGSRFVRLESLLPRLKDRKLLVISGGRDSYVPEFMPRRICELAGHSPEESHWVVADAKHNLERQASPAEFDARIVRFFEQMVSATLPEVAEPLAR